MPLPEQRENTPTVSLHDRLAKIRRNIERAASVSGRPASGIRLVGVTKTIDSDAISESLRAGLREVGENKIQEAERKRATLDAQFDRGLVCHHFLGHLQTNKAKKAVDLFDVIQSIDRPKLAAMVDRLAGERGKVQRCLVEVKVSPEPTKTGVPMEDAGAFLKTFHHYSNLRLDGLMTMAPFDVGEPETRTAFRKVHALFDEYRNVFGEEPVLSMGMTDDYEIAVEEGSTMVRIGRGIFGSRPIGRGDTHDE